MQGKKIYQEKLFANFQLSDRVPKNNFYQRLHEDEDLDFFKALRNDYRCWLYVDCHFLNLFA